jgi:tol-pal system protein YbgF
MRVWALLPVPVRVAALAGILGLAAARPAGAALFGDDEARKAILDLRERVAEQDRRLQEKDAELARRLEQLEAANRAQFEFANTVESQRREIASLRGEIEKLTNGVALLQQRQRDLYGDLDARLKKLEPVQVTIDGAQASVDRAEQSSYDAALAQFRSSDFRGAAASLQSLISRYPQSAYQASAHYWLGNSLYALKDYAGAIDTQSALISRFKDSPRAPDALLNIASSQMELKQAQQAADTLRRILAEYPDSETARTARDRLAAIPPPPSPPAPPPAKTRRR